jgi:UDP-N-acetylmuramate--alanine ligase
MQECQREPVHFIGIGGVGMSGIASVLLEMGCTISGSDICETHRTTRLARSGATIHIGHDAENLDGAKTVVYNTAIPDSNPELQLARQRGLRVLHRAQMLAELIADKETIAVAGTHGKTTTTSMLSLLLHEAGLAPTFVVGGDVKQFSANGRLGDGKYAVVEACESDGSFAELLPCSEVITNVEADHLDVHGSLSGVVEQFRGFMEGASPDGFLVACRDCPTLRRLIDTAGRSCITYGLSPGADFSATDIVFSGRGSCFTLLQHGRDVGRAELQVPGKHNILNALGALAAATQVGVPLSDAVGTLAGFIGAARRFDVITEANGVLVVDDYGHHPTEVKCTLAAAKAGFDRRIIAVFQPHLYSRTQLFLNEFATSFGDADEIVITDIYAAREEPRSDLSGADVWAAVKREEPDKHVEYIADKNDIVPHLLERVRAGDMVITIGAGDIRQVAQDLSAAFESAATQTSAPLLRTL